MSLRNWMQPAAAFLLALPWLWPISFGPYAEAMPWLFSLAMAASLLMIWPKGDYTLMLARAWVSAACLSVIPELIQYFGLARLDFFWPWIREAPPGYASGNIGQPNQQATFLGIALWSLCYLVYTGRPTRTKLITGAILALGMAATASRIGSVHMILLFLFAFHWGNEKKIILIKWYLFTLICYLVATLALPALATYWGIEDPRSLWFRLQTAEASCSSRRLLWANVLELIAAKPWTGWGWDNLRYAQYITLFEGPRWCAVLGNAHNLPLHLAVTLGIPAAIFLCTLLLFLILRQAPWLEKDPRRFLAWGVLVMIGAHSMVEFPLWYGPFQITVALCLYLLWPRKSHHHRTPLSSAPITIARYGIAAIMLGTSIFGFIDYWRVSQPYFPPQHRIDSLRGENMGQKVLDHASRTIFFPNQALFARLTSMHVDEENALLVNQLATYLLHFSPEPRILERLMDSALFMHDMEQAKYHAARFEAAYPNEYKAWANSRFPMGSEPFL